MYLIPKSPAGPPGLWLADRMIPPTAPFFRIRLLAAGVDRIPPRPTRTRPNPFAAAMRIATSMTSRLWNRPSPPITSVPPSNPSSASKIDWMKFSA